MPDAIGSLARRSACAALVALLLFAAPAAAQLPIADPPTAPAFMSRYDFHLSAVGLAVDDDRFTWDTHFGGDFDFVDYVYGRFFMLGDYQAVLGSEFRPFDPNQGNYTLAAGASVRVKGTEFMGVLHHISRHIGDRPKLIAIAWNELDLRVLRQFTPGTNNTVDLRLEGGKVIARADVDYDWTAGGEAWFRHRLAPSREVFGRVDGHLIVVNEFVGRGNQMGGRAEAGIRFEGDAGALELMAGVQRVIDADPFDRVPRQWVFAGFRLVTK